MEEKPHLLCHLACTTPDPFPGWWPLPLHGSPGDGTAWTSSESTQGSVEAPGMGMEGLLSIALRSVVDSDTLHCLAWLEVREASSGCAGNPCISAACGQNWCIPCFPTTFLLILPATENIHFLFVNINLFELGNLLLPLRLEALRPSMLPGRRAPHACYLLSDQL